MAYNGGYNAHYGQYPYPSNYPAPAPYDAGTGRKYGPEQVAGYDRGRNIDRSNGRRDDRRVVTNQPQSMQRPLHGGQREWSSGLLDCTKDMSVCCCVWCCSPFYECYIMEKDFGESCVNGWCLGTQGTFIALRYRFRDRHNIRGSLFDDCCTLTWCYLCAVCQMKRENDMLQRHGNFARIGDMDKH